MKNFKKLALVTLLTVSTLTTVACSSPDALPKEEVLKKSVEAFNNLKSLQSDTSGESYEQSTDGFEFKTKPTKNSFVADISTLNYKEETNEFTYYKIDNYEYSQLTGQPWKKSTVKIGEQGIKELILSSPLSNISKYNKDYTVNETDTTYEITFTPTDLKEYTAIQYANRPEAIRNNFYLEQYSSKVILDKSTLLPTSIDEEYKGAYILDGFYYKTTTTYSNYNSAPAITLPEDAKSAVEA